MRLASPSPAPEPDCHDFSVVEHEFRTPLAIIRGYADILSDELDDDKQHLLEPLQRQCRRLDDVVTHFLTAQELSRGLVTPNVQTWDVRMAVSSTLAPYAEIARENGVRVTVQFDDIIEARTDKACLERALAQVVENAVKFTEVGHVAVRVCRIGDVCRLTVTDTGIGLPSRVDELFKPFVQGSKGSTRSHGGLGTGLFIAQESLRVIKGEISLAPSVSGGTVATLQWPITLRKRLRRVA